MSKSKETDSQGLCQWYFKTFLKYQVKPNKFPQEFAIITAYNPLNQKLTNQENIFRNILLKHHLIRKYNGYIKSMVLIKLLYTKKMVLCSMLNH